MGFHCSKVNDSDLQETELVRISGKYTVWFISGNVLGCDSMLLLEGSDLEILNDT